MIPTLIFPCGHSYSLDNIPSVTSIRCAMCAREAAAKRAAANFAKREAANTAKRASKDHLRGNMAAYDGRIHSAILGNDPSTASLPAASHALLKAIYREHPYVFDAAERQGRKVARP